MAVSPSLSPFFVIFRLIIDLPEVIGIVSTAPERHEVLKRLWEHRPARPLPAAWRDSSLPPKGLRLTGCSNLPAGALMQDTINSMRGYVPGFGETAATAQDEVLRTFFISCFQKEYQRSRILWRN
jgi:hypothetical protein